MFNLHRFFFHDKYWVINFSNYMKTLKEIVTLVFSKYILVITYYCGYVITYIISASFDLGVQSMLIFIPERWVSNQ